MQPLAPSMTRVRLRMARDILRLSCLRYRQFDGFIASTKQSGNHWIKHILGTVIAMRHGLPGMEHVADHRLIGEPNSPPTTPGIPRIVQSHKIPSPLVHNAVTRRLLSFPPYVILVRDLRSLLVSHYERWRATYKVSFSQYLRGDTALHVFDYDIWDAIRFMNAWGRASQRMPQRMTVLKYEDMQVDAAREAERIWNFFGLPSVEPDVFRAAAAESTKERMKPKESGARRQTEVIRMSRDNPLAWYSPQDLGFVADVCRRHLKHNFGYDYSLIPDQQALSKAA
ncbi:MAG: sulfotransferase domain-containing protein [Planctomyces sp.]|nr:sulfotransferase domain-containing protein [Planctomyces sp.]